MTALAAISIDEALADPALLGAALGDLAPWQRWRSVLKAAFGIELNRDEARAFASIAGGRKPPAQRVRELWLIIGRRGGKSRMAALIASFIAAFVDHSAKLAPGELGFVLCLAPTQKQAALVLGYCEAFLQASPILAQLIESVTSEELRLTNGVVIAVHPASFRSIRGRTILAVVFDETAQFRSEESAQPDVEILRAAMPAVIAADGMAIGISTPFGQRGLLYTKHRDHFGKDGDVVLVIQAASVEMNPTLDADAIARESKDDPEAAQAEWLARFRTDLSSYVDRAVVEACVEADRRERPFLTQYRYAAFADPSGGQHDSFGLGISHREGDRVVLDLAREWKAPCDPAEVVKEIVAILREFRCTSVSGDRYGGAWVESEFRQHGVRYVPSDRNKSEIFLDALPLLTSGNAVLLDDIRLVSQISQLQRQTTRTARDVVTKMRGTFDDLANAALGSMVYAQAGGTRPRRDRPHWSEIQAEAQGCAGFNPISYRYG